MKVKFELAENVVMTDRGMRKVCDTCGLAKNIWDFPFNKRRVFMRTDTCNSCLNYDTKLKDFFANRV